MRIIQLPPTSPDEDSNGTGKPPCQRCVRENRECVLGGSNRGGRRIRKNKIKNYTPVCLSSKSTEATNPTISDNPSSASYPGPVVGIPPNPPAQTSGGDDDGSMDSVPRNPSDAWQCLTGIAQAPEPRKPPPESTFAFYSIRNSAIPELSNPVGIRAYRLVQSRSLDPETVWQLVSRYAENFHPYLPLVPRKYFARMALDAFSTEKHLTAVLTIASKDLVDQPEIHEYCSKYMRELIVAAGIPIGRLGTPEETANVVTMLIKTGYVTGQSLLLAGGLK